MRDEHEEQDGAGHHNPPVDDVAAAQARCEANRAQLAPPAAPRDLSSLLARVRALHGADAEGIRATQERLRAQEALRMKRELLDRADARGVPRHPGVRAAIIDEGVWVLTEARAALEDGLAWRARERRARIGDPPLTLVLSGPPGVGKSTVLARAVARWPRTALYVLARHVATLPENDWSDNVAARRRLAAVDLLAVDEAGLEESERAGPRVEALLAQRADNALVTLVATNLDADAFAARYLTDRLRSRLSIEQGRRGMLWWCEVGGADLRDPGALEASR